MMAALSIVLSIAIALILWPVLNLLKNYSKARSVGLPIIINPIDVLNPIWILIHRPILPFFKSLPFGLGDWIVYSGFVSVFANRYHLHAKHGPAYLLVTPKEISFFVDDPELAEEMLGKRKDLIKPDETNEALNLFGTNVVTLNGDDWARHRRITTPPFNERNSNNVWKESLAQATGMLQTWTSQGEDGVTKTAGDTMTLALHVLIAGGLGKSYSFAGGVGTLAEGQTMSYRDALKTILMNLLSAIILGSLPPIPSFFLTKKARKINVAVAEFRSHMNKMVEEERTRVDKLDSEKDNLLTALVRASDAANQGKGRSSLSHDEIMGNLFIYNLAGHDTTANTICYAIYILAAQPDVQEWLGEEIDSVFAGNDSVETWEYEKAFPKLKRCLALMYETLRLYGPVVFIPRSTGTGSRTVKLKGKEHILPPKTFIIISTGSLHTAPAIWGSDSLSFRPGRWISQAGGITDLEHEEIKSMPVGYLPWSVGPRSCPGKKFAQVEFVAVIAHLLRQHRVRAVRELGETQKAVKKRIFEVLEDSGLEVTIKMHHPEKVKLVWEKRT
ncbi:cytochrome P450 [Stipitochalara longipes BDJ]|nr:cytochrome P450 [Stipitochalara longipes BDJ]